MELIRIKSLLRLTAVRQEALRSFHRAEQVQQAARLEEERQKAEPKVESYPAFLTLGTGALLTFCIYNTHSKATLSSRSV